MVTLLAMELRVNYRTCKGITDVLNETISTCTWSNNNKGPYADRITKNLLVIKSQELATKISERKKEIAKEC